MRSTIAFGLAIALTSALPAGAQPPSAPLEPAAAPRAPAAAGQPPADARAAEPPAADAPGSQPAPPPPSAPTTPPSTAPASPQSPPAGGPSLLRPFPAGPAPLMSVTGETSAAGDAPSSVETLGSHQTHWQGSLGFRSNYVTHSGLDPFSQDNSVVQSSISFGRTLFAQDSLSVLALIYWEYGGTSGSVRGAATELGVHRWGLGPEVRWHLWPRLYVFGRPALTLHALHTELADAVAQTTFHSRKASTGFDLSGGIAVELYGARSAALPTPRFWIIGEGGYGWSQAVSQLLKPDEDAPGPVRLAPVTLPALALRGGFFKLSLAFTY